MLPWCDFTPCLKKLVQNNSESIFGKHDILNFPRNPLLCPITHPVISEKGVQYPVVELSINSGYQVYKKPSDKTEDDG